MLGIINAVPLKPPLGVQICAQHILGWQMIRNHQENSALLKILALYIFLLLNLSACERYEEALTIEEKTTWLMENSIQVSSIFPSDENFSDLQPLKNVIGDARIVMLGEQSHGDGSTFLAKTRLIKFLHQEMGFDVLAFESGLYDCAKSWELIENGEDVTYAIQQGVFSIWTQSEQVQPLIHYIGDMASSENPLEIAGFDSQFTGNASANYLMADLERFLTEHSISIAQSKWGNFREVLRNAVLNTYREIPITEDQYGEFLNASNALQEEILLSTEPNNPEAEFWVQMLESIEKRVEQIMLTYWSNGGKSISVFEMRDIQMGHNLIWLANTRYPNRKIIVWAATFHNVRNLDQIDVDDPETQELYDQISVMGDIVWGALGDQIYPLGFTAYEGSAGVAWDSPEDLGKPSEGSFEDLMNRTGFENAIVDFRNLPPGGEWLQERMVSRLLGYTEMIASWPAIMDGMMYTRDMIPSTSVYEQEN